METEITRHAKERMAAYGISDSQVKGTIANPDSISEGYGERKIYQKRLNGYVLRVIVEENKAIKRIITVYKARSGRYEI